MDNLELPVRFSIWMFGIEIMEQRKIVFRLNIIIWLLLTLITMQVWPVLRTVEGLLIILFVGGSLGLYSAIRKFD